MSSSAQPKRSLMDPVPEPKSKLGYYRVLSPNCGLRVSPLCLGTMNFGTAWTMMMGECKKESAFGIMDHFYESGGNFIDTANSYQDEESETWIGEWMEKRGNREEMIIATKYTSGYKIFSKSQAIQVNFAGNSRKSLHTSVEASLKKLKTSYIDLLYVHWWDYLTPVEEVMQSLNSLVVSGKVLYLGISDTPAWIVSRANQYARSNGLAPFVVYQGKWSVAERDFERDIIPMCKSEGMALAPWGSLGGGAFKTDEEIAKNKAAGEATRQFLPGQGYDKTRGIVKVLEKLAKAKNSSITGIALAYVLAKTPYVFPIVGGRKLEHIKDNIQVVEKVSLSDADIKELEAASNFDVGFPHNFIGQSPAQNFILNMVSKYALVDEVKAIQHADKKQ